MSAELYPPLSFHFKVTFEMSSVLDSDFAFQEVSGIESSLDTESVVEGGENRFAHVLPTRAKYSNLILKRGLMVDSAVQDWIEDAIVNFDIKPITVHVSLLNEEHVPSASWRFEGAWPVRWSLGSFDATQSGIAIETLELSYNLFVRVS